MAGYMSIHFSRIVICVQLPNQLWDFLAQAMGSRGLTPHEDLGKPGREFSFVIPTMKDKLDVPLRMHL